MEVESRAAKSKKSAEDQMDADEANRDVAPTPARTQTPALPTQSTDTKASASTDGGGNAVQTDTPQKPKRPAADDTPDKKKKRTDAAAAEALCAASVAAGENAKEAQRNLNDPDLNEF